MAKYVATNSQYVYKADYLVNGELVVPTSATITMTNNAGDIIGDLDEKVVTIVSGQPYSLITITAADNIPTLTNEVRYIDVDFVYGGITYRISDFYFLRASIRFPLLPADVLSVLGMVAGEVPDDMIDILSAYGTVQNDVGEDVDLDAILVGGGALLPTLIQAVRYKAAGFLSFGAQNSIMQMEQSDNTLYRRFMEIDWAAIDDKIRSEYARLLYLLQGSPADESSVISLMAVGTDPVTGA